MREREKVMGNEVENGNGNGKVLESVRNECEILLDKKNKIEERE